MRAMARSGQAHIAEGGFVPKMPKYTMKEQQLTGIRLDNELERMYRSQRATTEEQTGSMFVFTDHTGTMRQVYVRKGEATKFFSDVAAWAGRDEYIGRYKGVRYKADGIVAREGGWWKEMSERESSLQTATPIEMKKFTEKQLKQGQYDDLEKIQTPKPGEQFDMNQLAVAAVLTLNKMVDVIAEQAAKITELEERLLAQRVEPPVVEAPFRLKKLGDNYEDVRESA
jgi:hypothetical protein